MIALHDYFGIYEHAFWTWGEGTEVVLLVEDESTLVYKSFLIEVLEALALADTPTLDAVLLALVATKEDKTTLDKAQKSIMHLLYGGVDDSLEVPKGFEFLRVLQQLPASYIEDSKKRLLVLQTIFNKAYKAYNKQEMQVLLKQYRQLDQSTFRKQVTDMRAVDVNRVFRTLQVFKELAERYPTVEHLIEALEAVEETLPPELEAPEGDTDPDWREKLTEDQQTFYMAALLPALQAGLALPSIQRLQQQEAFGGTADLSNKGEFDRLLISEFAYDKTLFLSRLVNKEALYRQREASPERPSLTRYLLVDTSIYNWGKIKQLAFGIALALEHPENDSIVSHIYVLGDKAKCLYWNSISQIGLEINHVSPLLNAAEGLEDFYKTHRPEANQEVILISAVEAVQQPAVQQVIRQYPSQLHYWIAPFASGKISTYQYHKGKKLLNEFYLPLPELWSPNKVPSKKMEEQDHQLLPEKTPLLVAEPSTYEQLLWAKSAIDPTKSHLFMLANHGHVLRCQQQSNPHGWVWEYQGLADYTSLELGQLPSGDMVLLANMRAPKRLDLINLTQQTTISIDLHEEQDWYVKHLAYEYNTFYILDNHEEGWMIEITSTPTLMPFSDLGKLQQLQEAQNLFYRSARRQTPPSRYYQILRNIHVLSITQNGHLLINGRHQLQLDQHGVVKIGPRTSPTVISARMDYKRKRLRHFTFPDGSTVITNSLGMMVLTSSDEQLPSIYLPTALNKPIGMATQDHFCGNRYYYKSKSPDDTKIVTPNFFFTKYLQPFMEAIVGSTPLVDKKASE